MTEKPEASVLTARRAAQHFRLSSADDACEHLYILIVRSSLGPSPPNAGRYTVASVSAPLLRAWIHFPRAPEQFVTSPLCLVGYVRWDARSDRVPPLQTIIFSSFPGRTKVSRPFSQNDYGTDRSASACPLRQNGENQSRRPGSVVVNDVGCFHHLRPPRLILARIQVSIKSREVAAGNLEPQFVSGQEDIARRPQINADVINLSRICEFRFLLRIAVAQAQNAFRQILGKSVWPDVNQFPGKVCIHRRTTDIKVERNRTCHFRALGKCWRGEYERVAACFRWPLVLRADPSRQRRATKWSANRGDRVVGIVHILVGFLLGRSNRSQRAASVRAVRRFGRVKVIARSLGALQRPVIFVAPFVRSHDEDSYRLLLIRSIPDPFHQAVVPAEHGFIQVEWQLVPKINRANLSSVRSTRVSTHVDLQALAMTRCLRPRLFSQPCIVLQRSPQKNVVPRAQADCGNLNLREGIFDRPAFPKVVIVRVRQPVGEIGGQSRRRRCFAHRIRP